MADDETPETESVPPRASTAGRDPVVIEGEASELRASEGEIPPAAESAEEPYAYAPPEEAALETPPPPSDAGDAPSARRTSGASFGWGLAGAVVGGAVALGAAWFVEPVGDSSEDLSARLSALEARAPVASDKGLDARVGALETAQAGFAKATALDTLDKRLAQLESGAIKPDVLTAVQAEVRAARDDAAKALAQAAAAGHEKPAPPAATPDPRIAELAADEKALGVRIDKLETSFGERTGKIEAALGGRIDRFEAALGEQAGKTEGELGNRIDKLEAGLGARIGKVESALSAPKTETRASPEEVAPRGDAAAQAIAALALEQRLRNGEPFATELSALSRLGAESTALATLEPYAKTGVPTAPTLEASFVKTAPDVLAAASPESGDGALDKMLGHVRKLVRVRAVGEIAGDDPAALVSQIEGALAQGQVGSALGLFARLPEPARKAAADWAKTAEARGAADSAARTLRESAIARLAAAKN